MLNDKTKTKDADLPAGWAKEIDEFLVEEYINCLEEGLINPGHFWNEFMAQICSHAPDTDDDGKVEEGCVFDRVCARIGIDPNDTPIIMLTDYYHNRTPFHVELTGKVID